MKNKTVILTLKTTKEQHELMKKCAEKKLTSISAVIREAVQIYLERWLKDNDRT